MSISASYSSQSPRIVSPPLPITHPIFSGSIWIVSIRGACREQLRARPAERLGHLAEDEVARLRAWASASLHDLKGHAGDLDVHLQRGDPAPVPATLKSMSPR